MPELKDPTSVRSKIWNQLEARFPEAKLNPEWPLLFMSATTYLEAAAKSAQPATADGKPKPPPPKIPAKPKASPVQAKAKEAKLLDLKKQMVEGKNVFEQREARVGLLQHILDTQ